MILSLHIPKTGGYSFGTMLEIIYDNKCKWIRHAQPASKVIEILKEESIDILNLEVIHGHWPYGVHKYLSTECKYITFLRNPFERVLSVYQYNRVWHKVKEDISDWLSVGSTAYFDNAITRMLAGDMPITTASIDIGKVTELDYLKALNNLKSFYYIATTETYDEDLKNLGELLHWGILPEVERYHSFPNRKHFEDLTTDEIELIEKHFEYDIKLWYKVSENLKDGKIYEKN